MLQLKYLHCGTVHTEIIELLVNYDLFFLFLNGGVDAPPRAAAGTRFKFTEELWDLEARLQISSHTYFILVHSHFRLTERSRHQNIQAFVLG